MNHSGTGYHKTPPPTPVVLSRLNAPAEKQQKHVLLGFGHLKDYWALKTLAGGVEAEAPPACAHRRLVPAI
jgi:hypothetical protein